MRMKKLSCSLKSSIYSRWSWKTHDYAGSHCYTRHVYFGVVGANYDINILNRYDLFDDVASMVQYIVNGNQYNMGYHLVNEIYIMSELHLWRRFQYC